MLTHVLHLNKRQRNLHGGTWIVLIFASGKEHLLIINFDVPIAGLLIFVCSKQLFNFS